MAHVRPFRAFSFARATQEITSQVAPPYDVISPAQRASLIAQHADNIVALELPEGTLDPSEPGNRYETGATVWRRWLDSGVVIQDAEPAIYVLEQRFDHGGRTLRRRAFVTGVGLEPFDAGVVLPHERTLPKALTDRFELLRSTRVNTSQILGLFSDPHGHTDGLLASAVAGEPTMRAVDADGVESVVWTITDAEWIAELQAFMEPERVFIADGHHRYTVALAYRDKRRVAEMSPPRGEEPPAYESVMMALVNMDDAELLVLPTHRVVDASAPIDRDAFYAALEPSFAVEDLPEGHPAGVLAENAERPSFLVKVRGDEAPRLVRLRPEVDLDSAIPTAHSPAWKRLDVAVLQELILDPLLGVHPDRPETLERLSFVKDAHDALGMVGDHDTAFVMNPTRMDQMREVALAGETMPQKSTYFYPKLLSGLLLRSVD